MRKTVWCAVLCSAALSSLPLCAKGFSLSDIVGAASSIKTTGEAISKAKEDITPEDEYLIGRAVAGSVFANYRHASAAKLELYLNEICQALVLNSESPQLYNGYHVAVLDCDELNAFSTPGGHILITEGLIRCSKSEDSLASVIAHEIAHVQLKHPVKAIKSSRRMRAISAAAETASKVSSTSDFSGSVDSVSAVFASGYSQQEEFDADAAALKLMASAGYCPSAIVDMLTLLDAHTDKDSTGFGKTHPSPKLRLTKVKLALKNYDAEDTASLRQSRYDAAMKSF